MSNWEKDLERGDWFEEHVTRPWLLKNRSEWWITDTRNHKRYGKRGGPKLVRNGEELVLPDFRLDLPNDNISSWLDAKMKTNWITLDIDPTMRYYSLDPDAYDKYRKLVTEFPNMKFEILLGCARSCKLWLFDFRIATPTWHSFKNAFTRNNKDLTPCYPVSEMQSVGMWPAYNLP